MFLVRIFISNFGLGFVRFIRHTPYHTTTIKSFLNIKIYNQLNYFITILIMNKSLKKNSLQLYMEEQKNKRQKYQGSTLYRSVQSTVRLILRTLSKDDPRHEIVSKVLLKMDETKDVTVCSELDELSNQMFAQAREWMRFMKFGFIQITTKIRQYSKYEDPFMVEYLVQVQNEMEFGDFIHGYEKGLLKKKEQHDWTERFVKDWVKKGIEMKQNNIQLYKKKTPSQEPVVPNEHSWKRTFSSTSEQETAAQEHPRKRVKKESLHYYLIIMAGKSIVSHMKTEQEKTSYEKRLQAFRETQVLDVFKNLERETAKQLFEMRSYFKNFIEAFVEITSLNKFKNYDDNEMSNKVLIIQEQINPNNVFESYKNILLEGKHFAKDWPLEMKNKILERILELKSAETKLIVERQRQKR